MSPILPPEPARSRVKQSVNRSKVVEGFEYIGQYPNIGQIQGFIDIDTSETSQTIQGFGKV